MLQIQINRPFCALLILRNKIPVYFCRPLLNGTQTIRKIKRSIKKLQQLINWIERLV